MRSAVSLLSAISALALGFRVREPALYTSLKVLDDLLRGELGYDGVIVTDDLCMGAITKRPECLPRAAVAALSAGADLLLLSWDGEEVYGVLLDAERDGRLEMATLQKSARRLSASALWRQREKDELNIEWKH